MDFDNGVHEISNADYHGSSALSRSALMHFKKSPAHYFYEYHQKQQQETPTESMIMGEAVHTAILEPHLMPARFAVKNKVDGRTREGKAYNESFALLAAGKQVIDLESHQDVIGMQQAVFNNDIASALLTGCKIEHSIFFTHQSTGLQCKVRPDAWMGSIVNDLKTSNDAHPRAFQSSAYKYGYFLQAAMIKEALKFIGIDLERFLFIVVEKVAPFVTAIYDLDFEAIAYGVSQFNELMEQLARCKDRNMFPGYGVQQLTLPNYAQYDTLLETE